MTFLFVLIGLFFLITTFMPWVNHARLKTLREEISWLKREINRQGIKRSNAQAPQQAPISDTPQQKTVGHKPVVTEEETPVVNSVEDYEDWEEFDVEPTPVPRMAMSNLSTSIQNTFEQNIATKAPVWLGALSLIFAAFFLVKYSIELGWLGPNIRMMLAGLFGAFLLIAGQWVVKRTKIANAEQIAQGLIGAGLVTLYVTLYAATNLYSLLPTSIGFIGMAVVTGLAVVLSLRHGQAIAVFGLLGGLLTPALIGSDEPNAVVLFSYLFLLFSSMFIVLAKKGWWLLAIPTLLGSLIWSAFWFETAFVPSDAIVLVIFAIAMTAVVLATTGKQIAQGSVKKEDEQHIHTLNAVAIIGGVVTVIWLSFKITLGMFVWSMLGLLSASLMALAYFKPTIYTKPLFAKLGASLILFAVWSESAPLNEALAVITGLTGIYVIGSGYIIRRVSDPRFWVIAQTVAALALYLISYFALDVELSKSIWTFLALTISGLAIHQAQYIRQEYKADTSIQDYLIAVYALAASSFISISFAISLPLDALPLAIAGQVTATALIYQRTNITFLKRIMMLLTILFAGLHYEQLSLFLSIILTSIVDEGLSTYTIGLNISDSFLLNLGIPALLFAVASMITIKTNKTDQRSLHIIFGATLLLALSSMYYIVHGHIFAPYLDNFGTSAGFIERGAITLILALIGMSVVRLTQRLDLSFLSIWGVVLVNIALFRLVYFDFLMHNPYWEQSQFVGGTPIINGITLTYGLGILIAGWASTSIGNETHKNVYKGIAFAALFAFVTLTIRQLFHGGDIVDNVIGSTELYSYSVTWLITGIALLTYGIRTKNKGVRMASLAFMLLTVGKVFLFDAAELEGLLRIFSFLGLGVSLIGLSTFYTKFVFLDGAEQKKVSAS